MKLSKAYKMIRGFKKIPDKVKDEYNDSIHRRGIEKVILDRGISMDTKPFFRVLDKAIAGKRLGFTDMKQLKLLIKRLQKSKGLTEDTRYAIFVELPAIAKRLQKNKATDEDRLNLKEQVKPFIEWALKEQQLRVMQERRII